MCGRALLVLCITRVALAPVRLASGRRQSPRLFVNSDVAGVWILHDDHLRIMEASATSLQGFVLLRS